MTVIEFELDSEMWERMIEEMKQKDVIKLDSMKRDLMVVVKKHKDKK